MCWFNIEVKDPVTVKKLKLSSSTMQHIAIRFIIVCGLVLCVSSSTSSAPESAAINSEFNNCNHDSCQELRERVESLEEVVRAIVSALSDEKNSHFTSPVGQKIFKSRVVRSVLSTSSNSREPAVNQSTDASQLKSHHQNESITSNSVHNLKYSVKCSLAHMLDINFATANYWESNRESAGTLNVTLHRDQEENSIEIDWSPPSSSCVEFVTNLWIRVYEYSHPEAVISEPYLTIPRQCLKSKYIASSGKEAFSILLSSSNSSNHQNPITDIAECDFQIPMSLTGCQSYFVEVVPDYQSLRGKSIFDTIFIPPSMESMARLKSLVNVSTLHDAMTLNWEDNSGCASRLTSIKLRLWLDGVVPLGSANVTDDQNQSESWPITYNIEQRCLNRPVPQNRNIFSVTLNPFRDSYYSYCHNEIGWVPLDKCRKYAVEMESQYSSAWSGPPSSQILFTSGDKPGDYLTCRYLSSPSGIFSVSVEPIVNGTKKSGSKEGPTTLLISAKPNEIIWVDFAKLASNKRTKVEIYDGPYSTSPVILSHDDYKKPSWLRSTGPNLYVEYYAYENETHAYYTTMDKKEQPIMMEGCGGYINGDGVISSPNWNNIKAQEGDKLSIDECFWFIEARYAGGTVLLKRNNNSNERDLSVSYQQLHNLAVMYDGWNTSGAILYNDDNAKNKRNGDIIYSFRNKILVRFYRPFNTANHVSMSNSWNVSTIFTPNCSKGNLNNSSNTGLVKSPNYPVPYPKSSDCRWTILTAPGSTIRLLFAFFETKENEDFVYVYEGSTVYHPLIMEKSGILSTPFVVNSISNEVMVRFTSSDVGNKSFNGFLAVYSVV